MFLPLLSHALIIHSHVYSPDIFLNELANSLGFLIVQHIFMGYMLYLLSRSLFSFESGYRSRNKYSWALGDISIVLPDISFREGYYRL